MILYFSYNNLVSLS